MKKKARGFFGAAKRLTRMVVLGVLRSIELLLWAYALRGTNTFVVNITGNSSPLFVLAASVLIYHEKVPFKGGLRAGVTLCGLLIVSLSGGGGSANPLSIVLMLTAALDYTVSLFISRDLRTGAHPVPTALLMGVQFAVCTVIFIGFCLVTGAPLFPYTPKIVGTGVGHHVFCKRFWGSSSPFGHWAR